MIWESRTAGLPLVSNPANFEKLEGHILPLACLSVCLWAGCLVGVYADG